MTSLDEIPLPQLAPREAESHKGEFGRAVLIGGSRGMSGAIAMAGMATLRSGAGLVTLAVPGDILPIVAAYEPSYMTWELPSDARGFMAEGAANALEPLLARATCVAIGPGLNRSPAGDELVRELFAATPLPLICDADALNALAASELARPPAPRILTPHPGEFQRLSQADHADRTAMEQAAHQWAGEHGVILILKGHHSLLTDGTRRAHNRTGNPGMATGGVGDVLTGIITGLLAQGLEPLAAARLAMHVHGRAGDLACAELGEVAMIASDVLRYLPAAFLELARETR